MKETYTKNEDGGLTITWEAETPEDMAELKKHALRLVTAAETRDDLADLMPDPMPCPQGCGQATEDPYGGPCRACWDAISMWGEGG
ncbi:hypothetical protein [Spongiactinospora sp. TRM90649]|uniref:hypothetical protein n=1 Tax=Spongiactinospora sp. TRM90649 TaxID=3031114 RepID=UPI0023F7BFD3|nr:hypothetical protein [Spongiactinospora sp. TRM90649]MDF5758592.1 hypothetical protein [Spongiactinospora sp. TRM90649]